MSWPNSGMPFLPPTTLWSSTATPIQTTGVATVSTFVVKITANYPAPTGGTASPTYTYPDTKYYSAMVLEFYGAPSGTSYTINNIWIGQGATSGNAYNFAATPAPQRVTFNGANSPGAVNTLTGYQSDRVVFTPSSGQALMVSMDMAANSNPTYLVPVFNQVIPNPPDSAHFSGTAYTTWRNSTLAQAGTVAKTGTYTVYPASGQHVVPFFFNIVSIP